MNIFQELKARGFCYQETDEEAIEKLLSTERVKFYVGFDPTGNSLHVGHLLPVMIRKSHYVYLAGNSIGTAMPQVERKRFDREHRLPAPPVP